MNKLLLVPLAFGVCLSGFSAIAGEDQIKKAESAAPAAVSGDATIMLTDGTVLREGTNIWTCFPYFGDDPENDPICGDDVWRDYFLAEARGEEYTPSSTGVSYMLASGTPHMMILVPEAEGYSGFIQEPDGGKTWLMMGDLVGRHLIIPIEFESEEVPSE